jgi:hypothetical protein
MIIANRDPPPGPGRAALSAKLTGLLTRPAAAHGAAWTAKKSSTNAEMTRAIQRRVNGGPSRAVPSVASDPGGADCIKVIR